MKKRINYFIFTMPVIILIAALSLIFPEGFSQGISNLTSYTFVTFDWFILLIPSLAIFLIFYFAFSKIGSYRFGGQDAKPEYSTFSWIAMLFTAGIGVGIVFFGPLEGVWGYAYSLHATLDYLTESEAASAAMGAASWLWGVPAWATYAIGGLIAAYFSYRHSQEMTISTGISYGLRSKKWSGLVGHISTAVIVIATGVSLSASYAMASQQVNEGIQYVTGNYILPNFVVSKIVVLIILGVIVALISITPIRKGMKNLGNFTVILSIILMIFIFLVGPTRYFVMNFFQNFGGIFLSTIKLNTTMFIFSEDRYWMTWFVSSYWVWWIAWTPFVGTFLARISKGRTIKEFLLGSTLIPAAFLIIWFSIFSAYGILDTIKGSGSIMEVANSARYEGTIYNLLELFPLTKITQVLVIILFSSFVITTAISGSISLGIMTSKDGINARKLNILSWAVFIPCIAFSTVVSGEITGIKSLGSWVGFPYYFFFLISIAGFIKQYRQDRNKHKE